METKDALDKLIVDEEENPNVELLAELVLKFLKFDKKTGEIIFNKEFSKLKDGQKILIYLLGRKVIFIKKLQKNFDEKIAPKEITDAIGGNLAKNRVYLTRELKGILKSEKGKHFVPNYNLYKCKEKLEENGRTNSKKKN
jgi:hypothetical protein